MSGRGGEEGGGVRLGNEGRLLYWKKRRGKGRGEAERRLMVNRVLRRVGKLERVE